MTEQPRPSPINEILNALASSAVADKIVVFGSTARGARRPGDVDAVVDMRPLTRKAYLATDPGGKALGFLLNIAANRYGWFDPFLRFENDDLLVRSADARSWIKARNAAELLANIDQDGKRLADVIAMRQAAAASLVSQDATPQAARHKNTPGS